MKIKKYIFLISFIIIALFVPCLNIFGFYFYLSFFRYYSDITNIIVILSVLIFPFLSMIFAKLYRKHEININEKILFAISVSPFLCGIGYWLKHDSYYIWRWFLNPYKTGIPFANNLLAQDILWNLALIKFAVITGILLFVISNLRKENKIKYADFLAFNFIFVGIYQTMRNLECFHMNVYLVPDSPVLEHLEMMLKIFGLAAPLYLGMICAIITMITYFLRKYFSKAISIGE